MPMDLQHNVYIAINQMSTVKMERRGLGIKRKSQIHFKVGKLLTTILIKQSLKFLFLKNFKNHILIPYCKIIIHITLLKDIKGIKVIVF